MKVNEIRPLLASKLCEIRSNSPKATAAKMPTPTYKTNLSKDGARSITYQYCSDLCLCGVLRELQDR